MQFIYEKNNQKIIYEPTYEEKLTAIAKILYEYYFQDKHFNFEIKNKIIDSINDLLKAMTDNQIEEYQEDFFNELYNEFESKIFY